MFLQDLAFAMSAKDTQLVAVGLDAWNESTETNTFKELWRGIASEIPIKYSYNQVSYITSELTDDGQVQIVIALYEY